MKVREVHFFDTAKFMRRICNHSNPDVFAQYFIPIRHGYTTRGKDKSIFAVPQPRTNHGKRSIKYNGILVWTKVPPEIKNIVNNVPFKYKLKEHILENNAEE